MINDPRRSTYTRRQIAELTGASESSLNFWMREEVLRPSTTSGGKGNHRKFPFYEVHIAALFKRLHQFGCGIEAFRQLSGIFHTAIDYIDDVTSNHSLSEEEWEAAYTLLIERRKLLRDGYIERMVQRGVDEYPGFKRYKEGPYVQYVRLSWNDILDEYRKSRANSAFTDNAVSVAEILDPSEFIDNRSTYYFVTNIPPERYEDELDYFVRDDQGQWTMTPDPAAASRISDVYLAVAMHSIKYSVWNGDA